LLLLCQVVGELLQQLGATGDEPVQTPSWHYTEDPAHSTAPAAADGSISLRHALGVCYDIKTPKAQQLLQLLLTELQQQQQQQGKGVARVSIDVVADASAAADLSAAGVQQQTAGGKQDGAVAAVLRLQGLLADAASLEQYLSARHVVDVLQDFSQVPLSYSQVRYGAAAVEAATGQSAADACAFVEECCAQHANFCGCSAFSTCSVRVSSKAYKFTHAVNVHPTIHSACLQLLAAMYVLSCVPLALPCVKSSLPLPAAIRLLSMLAPCAAAAAAAPAAAAAVLHLILAAGAQPSQRGRAGHHRGGALHLAGQAPPGRDVHAGG
jgi:hypothetical protein